MSRALAYLGVSGLIMSAVALYEVRRVQITLAPPAPRICEIPSPRGVETLEVQPVDPAAHRRSTI